jgi:hypothetical protein
MALSEHSLSGGILNTQYILQLFKKCAKLLPISISLPRVSHTRNKISLREHLNQAWPNSKIAVLGS